MTPLLTLGQAAALMQFKDVRTLKKALSRAGISIIGVGRSARLASADVEALEAWIDYESFRRMARRELDGDMHSRSALMFQSARELRDGRGRKG